MNAQVISISPFLRLTSLANIFYNPNTDKQDIIKDFCYLQVHETELC